MPISIPASNTMEFIEQTQVSPLISKCSIKVCYVGQAPNRNNTVITKELAWDMGRQLPGSPIVGYYNEETKDFQGHERDIEIKDGKFRIIDTTKPYGFVPTDAKVWFQKFLDNGTEHEYLCTEGYLWTGAYPESKRVIDKGNGQSMEINDNATGFWTNDVNSDDMVFIYNEALIEKLCILGEAYEPCFEGAEITKNFSLEFNRMLSELQDAIKNYKGGSDSAMDDKTPEIQESEDLEYEKKEQEEEKETKSEDKTDKEDTQKTEDNKEEESADEDEENKKKNYSLEEYQTLETLYNELNTKYSDLKSSYSALTAQKSSLEEEVTTLRNFKVSVEKEQKQAMIDSFYMLSDEDKKDVVDNINSYSLDDIEAKLSVICTRRKLNLAEEQEGVPSMFSLEGATDNDNAPAWIKRVREYNK